VFEKNPDGAWIETQILESFDTEDKFGLYLSAENNALAVGSAVATSLFALEDNNWHRLWYSRVAPYSVALGIEALAIGTPDGLKVLAVDEFYYADEDAGLFLANAEFGATLEDNLDGTRTFRWQTSGLDNGVYTFEVVATNALDSAVRSTTFIDIYIED